MAKNGKQSDNGVISCDVAIIGGGHSGCTLAALLGAQGIGTVCIDMDDPAHTQAPDYDARTTAISYGSQKVIAACGAWDEMAPFACAITDIQITEDGAPTLLTFDIAEAEADAFGWIIENSLIRKALFGTLEQLPAVRHIAPAKATDFKVCDDYAEAVLADGRHIRAKLIVGADGRKSPLREWMGIETRGRDYGQTAIVCIVTHDLPHNGGALEDFRADGPFAVLPMLDDAAGRHRSAVVWTEHARKKHSALGWDEETFNRALNERFPDRYGHVTLAGKRFAYPLNLTHAHSYTGPRMALIADAAHGIHPIAGQGLNLGLRDVAALA